MADITLTIPNQHVDRIKDAFEFFYPEVQGTPVERFKKILYRFIRRQVLEYENRNVQDEANQTKETELNNDIPDV